MAVVPLSCSLFKPSHSPPPAPLRPALPILHAQPLRPPHSARLRFPSLPTRRPLRFSAQGNGGASEILEESEADEERKKPRGEVEEGGEKKKSAPADASVAEELKEMMEARRKESSSSSDFWGGVAEEVREIEWPPFGKVVGTTGVVLAVIAGSSVALLTVNAILAEISDKVFAGKGFQDFF